MINLYEDTLYPDHKLINSSSNLLKILVARTHHLKDKNYDKKTLDSSKLKSATAINKTRTSNRILKKAKHCKCISSQEITNLPRVLTLVNARNQALALTVGTQRRRIVTRCTRSKNNTKIKKKTVSKQPQFTECDEPATSQIREQESRDGSPLLLSSGQEPQNKKNYDSQHYKDFPPSLAAKFLEEEVLPNTETSRQEFGEKIECDKYLAEGKVETEEEIAEFLKGIDFPDEW